MPLTFTDANGVETLVTPSNPLPVVGSVGGGGGSDPVIVAPTVLGALNAAVSISVGQRDTLAVQVTGTFVGTIVLEANLDDGTWLTLSGATQWQRITDNTNVASITAAGIYQTTVSALKNVRLRMSAYTSGAATASLEAVDGNAAVFLDSPLPAGSNTIGTVNLGSGGTAAASLGKAEDNAHASGDTGVAFWGVRAPSTPATPTSAPGDYGYVQVDVEGKIVMSGAAADPSLTFNSAVTLTSTTAAAARAAQAAGIRTYVTDVTVSNSSATPTKVVILDGSTVLWRAALGAGASITKQFSTPLRGTAATALNVNLLTAVTDVEVSVGGYSGV